jgi:signal transduction histidine kinase
MELQSEGGAAGAVHGALQTDIPDAPVIVDADAGMLRQALTNLLKNAGEAVEECLDQPGYAPLIRVTLETCPEAVCIRIIDNGPGLPADRSRLFEPYVTLKSTGTGLGLPGSLATLSLSVERQSRISAQAAEDLANRTNPRHATVSDYMMLLTEAAS